MDIDYQVIYSDRKTLRVTVERDRSVVVRAPSSASRGEIERAIEKKKFWLYQKIRHPQKYDVTSPEAEFLSGTSLLYIGQEYRLDISRRTFEGVRFDNQFTISKASIPFAADLLRAWYIEEAKAKIVPKAKFYAKHIGVEYNEVFVSDLKYRWGSCTPSDNLNFNWRLIKAPMSAIEYVIVHELAHLLEHNHTRQFWHIVKAQVPQYRKAKDWLKQHGSMLEVKV